MAKGKSKNASAKAKGKGKIVELEGYFLEQLKDEAPEVFARLHEAWAQSIDYIPWADETMDSLKAVVEQSGASLANWSIGTEAHSSYVKVNVDDYYWRETEANADGETEEEQVKKDAAWYWENCITLRHKECAEKYGTKFPGACALTGYCADDTFQEHVYKALEQGETLTEALEGLADVASRMMEDDLQQQQNEESFIANHEGQLYTLEGKEIPV